MYDWRKMTEVRREEVLKLRRQLRLPWHSPPHRESRKRVYHLYAACYEHKPHIGMTEMRMALFSESLLGFFKDTACPVYAWCVLPNHYHALIRAEQILNTLKSLGQFHGRTSFRWNAEDSARGRQVWCKSAERGIRSDRHYWATINYIHHNPVHHGYVVKWGDWPFSSAKDYLADIGRKRVAEIWRDYPLLDYGKTWDK